MSWLDDAACRQHDPRWWFSDEKAQRNKAISVCAECPVAKTCLATAIKRSERFGIWGGRDFGAAERNRQYRATLKYRERVA